MRLFEQIYSKMNNCREDPAKPWKPLTNKSHKWEKIVKHRVERRRAKNNPECQSWYNRFSGWEW